MRNAMKTLFASIALALVAAAASVGAQPRMLTVIVTPDAFRLGTFVSPLATPVVHELVRARPDHVVLVTCTATPPAKLLQFETELKARHPTRVAIALSDTACVGA